MKPKQVAGKIISIDKKGRGILGGDDIVVVQNTCPGDVIEATTFHRRNKITEARLDKLVQSSKDRVTPLCRYSEICGGCKMQHINYNTQLEAKTKLINQAFQKNNLDIELKEVFGCQDLYYYRNRMDYTFGPEGQLGLREAGKWWSVIDLSECHLLSKDSIEILRQVRDWANDAGFTFWDSKQHQGFWRYCVIREGKNTNQRMVNIITSSQDGVDKKMNELPKVIGDLSNSIVWGINDRPAEVSVSDEIRILQGDPWIEEEINGFRYRIHPNSFFQTNSLMAAKLQDTVSEFCGDLKNKTLLDLYCGSGFFGINLARSAKQVVGIELDPFGIANAEFNAELNKINNIEFFVSAAEKFDWSKWKPEVVIVDPPRAGLHPKVINVLMEEKPKRIVYVSCNYEHLAEELKKFLEVYKIEDIRALDLFPHTPHVEVVVSLIVK